MIRALASMYSWRFPLTIVALLQHNEYQLLPFWKRFWQTSDFSKFEEAVMFRPGFTGRFLAGFVSAGMIIELLAGFILIVGSYTDGDHTGWLAFGAALVIAAPVVWSHMVAIPVWLSYIARPKYVGRRILARILEAQVRRLRKRHTFKVVGIVGSVGKTSTKAAIAKTLSASKRVLWQEGNYNVDITVPLVLFGQPLPSLFNVVAWTKIWFKNQRAIGRDYPYDVVVLELGTDAPGQIKQFAYLQPDVVVVTAITPEHMEFFGTLDAVAEEELAVLKFAKRTLINVDDTPAEYLAGLTYTGYGLAKGKQIDYYLSDRRAKGLKGQEVTFHMGKKRRFTTTISLLGDQGAKFALAAAATADLLGETTDDIKTGLGSAEAFAGRMRLFEGIKQSTLIDDTYNASPIAVTAALDVLYATDAPQRIAVLGTMNELGAYSPEAHREVGDYCDPKKLDLVVTIGNDAKEFLAPVAKEKGCEVHSFMSPYAAGEFVTKRLKKKAAVLAKGSQNGVFAEETLKMLLKDKTHASDMVRQSSFWMQKKYAQFSDHQ